MAFIGLQPLTADSNLPQFMRSSLSLYEATTNQKVPCDIVSSKITREYTIPREPVEANIMVNDTIIYMPVNISLELYIYEEFTKEFFRIINEIQKGNNGFIFIDRKETIYNDLFMTSFSYEENADQLGAFNCSVELTQVNKVHAVKSIKTIDIPATPIVNKGNTIAEPAKDQPKMKSGLKIMQETGENLFDKLKEGVGIPRR